MLRTTIAVAMLALLAGCGKSEAPPAAESAPAAEAPAAAPAPEAAAQAPEAAAQAPEAAAPAAEAAAPATEAAAPAAEAAAPAAEAAAPAAEAAAPAAEAAAPAAEAAAPAVADAGKGTYDKVCSICHGAGVAGAPKLGDKADWGPRIAQGKDTLYEHAIKGFMGQKGMMPPKGGNTALSDDEVKAAVDYMAAQAE
jgi:cytochrome c5